MADYSDRLISVLVTYLKYAKHLPHQGRREDLAEIINRNMAMQLDRFPKLSKDIVKAYHGVHGLKVLPSMRAMQFSGEAILKNNARQFNCSYTPVDDVRSFGEILFLLLSGVGVGFSVQKRHTEKLPKIVSPRESGHFTVQDSILGWAQAVDLLMDAYLLGRVKPNYDFGDIRSRGSYLVTTGAKAPGPEPLKKMLELVESKLKLAVGRKLRPIEIHDIVCIISDSVLAGGIRRSATISLFDRFDQEMLTCKQGEWWNNAPWRARANNSAVLPRSEVTQEEFYSIFEICRKSGSGEPGFFWTSNNDWGTNPCVSGDTEILTDDGYVRIDSVVDKEVNVYNGENFSKVIPKITGHDLPMVSVTFSDGRSLRCTEHHKFHIAKNYRGDVDVVKAKDLEAGMKLIKHNFPVIEHGPDLEDAYVQGFVAAEGMELNTTLYVYKPKEMCLPRLQQAIKLTKWEGGNKRYRIILKKTPVSKKMVPVQYNLKSKLEWLSGLFDGDGTELKEGGLQLVSVNREFLANLQKLLSTVGVQCKILFANKAGMRLMPNHKGGQDYFYCQDAYRVCIGAVQMQFLKSLGMKCERMAFNKKPQRDASQFVTIVDVTEDGIEDTVYCFNEPKRHLGIFNGVITGQCAEIALNPNQFCNLTTINQTNITSEKDYLNRIYAASLIGTLQATYTDFPYLRPIWQKQTEEEALIGVSFTGVADGAGFITSDLLRKGANLVKEVNEKYAKKLGINLAARTTTIKPEGTSSCILASSSGIHARHSDYYIRRIRINKDDALATYLRNTLPELIEDDLFSSTGCVISIPQKSPEGAITRHAETAKTLFDRSLFYRKNWIEPGHRTGINKHNVSVTISVRENEWDLLKEEMWNNREYYSGISLLPMDLGTYKQAPFEDCDKDTFERLSSLITEIDLKLIREETDNTNRIETLACAGGQCEIT